MAGREIVEAEVVRRPQDITTIQEMGLALSETYIETIMGNIKLLTDKFKDWLEAEIDYTTKLFPGQRKPALLDTGASKFFGFFRCWPRHRVLERYVEVKEGEERLRVIVAAQAVSSLYGYVVAEGVGSCSTDEKKYKYRWVDEKDLREVYGWGDDDFSGFKSEIRSSKTYFYVRNPELLDLENTIVKMAAKRAEVDAALQLPGVGAVFTQDMGDRLKREQLAREAEIKAQAQRDREERLHDEQPPDEPDDKPKKPKVIKELKATKEPTQQTIPAEPALGIQRPEAGIMIGPDWMKGTLEQLGVDTTNLDFESKSENLLIWRKGFLADGVYNKIGQVVKELGGEWVREGSKSHWKIPA